MTDRVIEGDLRTALYELQRYLSDQVAPLMAAESVDSLLEYPPDLVASEVKRWVVAQYHGLHDEVAVSEYLFHAIRKLHMLSEFDLIENERLGRFLDELTRRVLGVCPEPERDWLLRSIRSLGRLSDGAPPVPILQRPTDRVGLPSGSPGPQGPMAGHAVRPGSPLQAPGGALPAGVAASAAAPLGSTPMTATTRRFSMLLSRAAPLAQVAGVGPVAHAGAMPVVGPVGGGGAGAPVSLAPAAAADVLPNLYVAAAAGSRAGENLEDLMRRMGESGFRGGTGQAFRVLGASLPGWSASDDTWYDAISETLGSSGPVEAMHELITAAKDPKEGAKRFHEMVQAAIERFNQGHLVQATAMFELAERIIQEKTLSADLAARIRESEHENLDMDRLREYAEQPERHPPLRKVLAFFPAFTIDGLLAALRKGETRRDRRRLMLALLEAHGEPARIAVLAQLEACASGSIEDKQGFYIRNLLFLLRRIPRPAGAAVDREIEFLIVHSRPGNPEVVTKEAVWTLSLMKHPRAERVLMSLMRTIEGMLDNARRTSFDPADLFAQLDRVIAGLARYRTPATARMVVEHALARHPAFGDTMARLGEFSEVDLSFDKDLVASLVETIRAEMPRKVLGLAVHRPSRHMLALISAVSGTPSPAVRQVLDEIVSRFPGEEIARVAAKALEGLGVSSRSAETPARAMSGDLELFGLPNLLQSLSESQVNGTLRLDDGEGRSFARLTFQGGKIVRCRSRSLKGEEAFYQIFERPSPGTFVFSNRVEAEDASGSDQPIDVMPAVLEALRRYDEFQQACALVSDTLRLEPTGQRPKRPDEEEDGAFLKTLWTRVASGATATDCEATVPTDSYRIRRVLAFWLEQGALQPALAE